MDFLIGAVLRSSPDKTPLSYPLIIQLTQVNMITVSLILYDKMGTCLYNHGEYKLLCTFIILLIRNLSKVLSS